MSMSEEEKKEKANEIEEFYKRKEEIERTIPDASITDMVNHIDHAVKIAGINHVGIGTDFDGGAGSRWFYEPC